MIVSVAVVVSSRTSPLKSNGNGVMVVTTNVDADVTFYVTSDTPYSNEDQNTLTLQLSSLDVSSAAFLVHVGGVEKASITQCSSTSYSTAASILKSSPIPVFVIPGDNDWAECPNPSTALDFWRASFVNFETRNKFKTGILPSDISSQGSRAENFCFLLNGVLFIGLNLISQNIPPELTLENIQWIEMNLSSHVYGKNEYRSVIILGYTPILPTSGSFFWSILDTLTGLNKPVLYIHSNDGSGDWKRYAPFPEYPKIEAVMLQNGGDARPVKVTATRDTKNAFNLYR